MRLINARTFKLKEFSGKPPHYAILSHTWGDDEVTFQDMADLDRARRKLGFSKIERCCQQALRDGLDWAWVDTCCIDKSSSAELSESINSMFAWYEGAMKCYAFLSDVSLRPVHGIVSDLDHEAERDGDDNPSLQRVALFESRWWKRGWTLQELIAPHNVEFYNCDWEYLTCKRTWKQSISRFCIISPGILDHSARLESVCAAEKISWVSGRDTTRPEDMAYCLLGILGVSMPLLYGEGAKSAFWRLQEQVIAKSEDYSLFLWEPDPYILAPIADVLASSPRNFHVTEDDFDDAGPLGKNLHGFLTRSAGFGARSIAREWRLRRDDLARHFCLGAFPMPSNREGNPLPCILLLDLASVDGIGDFPLRTYMHASVARPYLRMNYLLHALPRAEVVADQRWALKSCYIMPGETFRARPEENDPLSFLFKPRQPALLPIDLWIWRSPQQAIPGSELDRRGHSSRRCLHLKATGALPGCLVYLAVEPGRYWMGHALDKGVDPETEARRFHDMDLSDIWVETARTAGPIAENRLDFETRSLVMTLYIDEWSRYRVFLAIVERPEHGGASSAASATSTN
ncbi:5ef9a13c-4fad-4aa7-aede-151cb176ec88 [Thermothielavioides terrestris]|uniref:5ef9a13c-4fad-4aa7-aede-151cb176ec88 n=1 Tax=Thermothielavioides terrestris TaxID=2587410 RepID=A0A3S4BME0_9PEZI|nr:5ef9a13c-4fad-4aa7-aede-151cb176ec88 [Thermothielavioides terrestris]